MYLISLDSFQLLILNISIIKLINSPSKPASLHVFTALVNGTISTQKPENYPRLTVHLISILISCKSVLLPMYLLHISQIFNSYCGWFDSGPNNFLS